MLAGARMSVSVASTRLLVSSDPGRHYGPRAKLQMQGERLGLKEAADEGSEDQTAAQIREHAEHYSEV